VPVVNDYIDIPHKLTSKQQNVILCIDGNKVNGLLFLTTISKNICYQTAQYIESKSISKYQSALKEVIQLYNKAGFKITKIRADNEFRPLKETLFNNFGINMNFSNPQEHVPEAERNKE
jgi:hypothetical protein